jgi:CheY-like chemotaxis protein
LLRGLLAHAPFRTIEAVSGEEGLALARHEQPAAIFLDLVMPEMDGFETLARLRADPATREIPVIINTSSDLDAERRAELSTQTAAILSKRGRSRDEAAVDVERALAAAGVVPARRPGSV